MSDQQAKEAAGRALAAVGEHAGVDIAAFRRDLETFVPQIVPMLGGGEKEAAAFVELVTTAYLQTPRLAKCDPVSMIQAVRRCAQLRLRPDGVEGAFIPRGGKAHFEPMFQGIVRKMLRTATVKKVEAQVVFSGDHFDYEFGLEPFLRHKRGPSADRGGVTHAYAIVWLANGEKQFEVMDREELDKIRRISKAQNNGKEGPAWTNYPAEMQRKIVVKRLSKYIEQDAEMAAVLAYDNALELGQDMDPADVIPEAEWRTVDERATEHADRMQEELRNAVDRQNGGEAADPARATATPPVTEQGEQLPQPNGGASPLDLVLTFGKHEGSSLRELVSRGGGERGYVTHWVLTDKCTSFDQDTKEAIRAAIDALDADLAAEDQQREEDADQDAAEHRRMMEEHPDQEPPPGHRDGGDVPPPPAEWGDE